MTVNTTDDLVRKGKSLVIIALIGDDLHIRIFNESGKINFDKAMNELKNEETNEDLAEFKKLLSPLHDEFQLSKKQTEEIVDKVSSIAGVTLGKFPTSELYEQTKRDVEWYTGRLCGESFRVPTYIWLSALASAGLLGLYSGIAQIMEELRISSPLLIPAQGHSPWTDREQLSSSR